MKFQRIVKLWRFLCYFLSARKVWHWPKHSDVLILDAAGQEFLLEYLKPWNPETLHVRGEQINVRILLASITKSGRRADAYIDCFIERVAPRLVVTWVDNNINFYFLQARNKNIRTLFVQNGPRGTEVFEELDLMPKKTRPRVDQMLVVAGRYVPIYTKRFEGTVTPIGSLRNNTAKKKHLKKNGTIAFISQFRDTKGFVWGGKFRSRQEFFEQSDRFVLTFLMNYSKKHGKELFIVPCAGHYKDDTPAKERAYYNRLMGMEFTFSEWKWHGSSYDAVDTAEVVVGIDSTLGYESAARGNKTAFFAMRSQILQMNDRVFAWPLPLGDDGPFWTNRADTAAFERILDHLFAIDSKQWQSELDEHNFRDILAYDPGNTIFQSVLHRELGAPPKMDHLK